MKMKNLLIGGMSLALVACISIGGTLAYLQAADGTLTNKFTFAGDIVVDVYETTDETQYVTKEGEVEGKVGGGVNTQGGITYGNLIPGQELNKDVKLDVQTTFETYLYVNIQPGANGDKVMELPDTLTGWTAVEVDDDGYGIYRKTQNVAADTPNIAVFDTVTVPDVNNGSTENVTIKDIVIDVWAAQASTFTDTSAADKDAIAHWTPAP